MLHSLKTWKALKSHGDAGFLKHVGIQHLSTWSFRFDFLSLSPEGTFLSDFVTKVDLSLYSETVSIHPSMAICQFAYMG